MRDLHEDSHLVMRHYLYHTASITAECFAEVLSDHYQMLFYLIITKSFATILLSDQYKTLCCGYSI